MVCRWCTASQAMYNWAFAAASVRSGDGITNDPAERLQTSDRPTPTC